MNDLSYHILKILETEGEKDIVDLWTHFDLKVQIKETETGILAMVAILGNANWIHHNKFKKEPIRILPLGRQKYLEEKKIRQRAIKIEPHWLLKSVVIEFMKLGLAFTFGYFISTYVANQKESQSKTTEIQPLNKTTISKSDSAVLKSQ